MTGAEQIFDAITQVRDDYVDAAGDYRFARRRWTVPAAWRQYAALAACLVLIVGGVFALSQVRMGSCLLYTSPSPRDATLTRIPSSA